MLAIVAPPVRDRHVVKCRSLFIVWTYSITASVGKRLLLVPHVVGQVYGGMGDMCGGRTASSFAAAELIVSHYFCLFWGIG